MSVTKKEMYHIQIIMIHSVVDVTSLNGVRPYKMVRISLLTTLQTVF
jgi:hypothetical protein